MTYLTHEWSPQPFRTHKKISIEEWKDLLKFIPVIEATTNFGSLGGGQQIDDGVYVGFYTIPGRLVTELVDKISGMGLVPVFDWNSWTEGMEMISKNDTDYSKLELVTLTKLFTVMVRQDRFSDGFLIACFERGVMLSVLKAIKTKLKLWFQIMGG